MLANLALSSPGGHHPGPVSGCVKGSQVGVIRASRRATLLYMPAALTGYCPSDAAWKQRLGLNTLSRREGHMPELRQRGPKTSKLDGQTARNNHSREKVVGNDLVVFELFFFSSPHIPGKVGVPPWLPANVEAPSKVFAVPNFGGEIHKSPRSHMSLLRFRCRGGDMAVLKMSEGHGRF